MTIRRDDDVIFLESACGVEDAEILLQAIQSGATMLDWGGCTYLHTGCLQLMMASSLPLRGLPDAALTRWVAPMLLRRMAPDSSPEPQQILLMEVQL
jgi:hypothetical protein